MKKYELSSEHIIAKDGVKLYRIRALRNFGNIIAGDLGGYIQSEDNLSHDGTCWVYDSAIVRDFAIIRNSASIYDSAIVRNTAIVWGSSKINDVAIVCDRAEVYDSVIIGGSAIIGGLARLDGFARVTGKITKKLAHFSGLTYTINPNCETAKTIRVGCQVHTLEEWERDYLMIAKEYGLSKDAEKYIKAIRLIAEVYFG